VTQPFEFEHTRAFVASFPPCARDLVIDDGAVVGPHRVCILDARYLNFRTFTWTLDH